jgi:hypothetical protein
LQISDPLIDFNILHNRRWAGSNFQENVTIHPTLGRSRRVERARLRGPDLRVSTLCGWRLPH